jgi:DNA-binding NarL/FixJ family response regulator
MSWLRILLENLGLIDQPPPVKGRRPPSRAPRRYRSEAAYQAYQVEVDPNLHAWLQELAEQEQIPVDEVASDLLQKALQERQSALASLQSWRGLSPRQQEVAALICLGYTNQQIATRLHISAETVKTHTRNLLQRFGMRTKLELRQVLSDWDFSAWK